MTTVTGLVDINEIEEELVVFLRNQDVMSISTRGVTTTTDSGSWSNTTSHLIAVTNIKNIRSITVDATPLAFGTDYTVDYNFLDTTIKTKITLNSAQTGAYVITYDYGTDKIFPDWPRDEITIGNYPRMSVEVLNAPAVDDSLDGLHTKSEFNITVSVFADSKREVYDFLKSVREDFLNNKTGFYYIPYITIGGLGPMLSQPDRRGKIVMSTLQLKGMWKMEVVS